MQAHPLSLPAQPQPPALPQELPTALPQVQQAQVTELPPVLDQLPEMAQQQPALPLDAAAPQHLNRHPPLYSQLRLIH